ncbi:NYN domain-containing protein [Candidatus Pacearchaeota archaeon]|nr:NYN domain-containing protein [Candidatus Pacearchaeota archaeon]MBI2057246.1 NYN domain-containing protein [Candidatus Pacearchaeota archaeon]
MSKTLVFIDGGFLSRLSKHFGKGKHLKFDYLGFSKSLAKKKNLLLEKIFYYTAPPFQPSFPNKEEILRKKGYDKFISKFSREKFVEIREGRVQKLINSSGEMEFHQKGVDTLMTLDLAFVKDKFHEIKKLILVTSDTDFCPVIKELKKFGIDVVLFTYSDKKRDSDFFLSNHLVDCCSEVEYLEKEDLLKNSFKQESGQVKNEKEIFE